MTNIEQAKWMAMGYKTKIAMRKLHPDLWQWSLFKNTFGFFQWKKKSNPSDEQLKAFQEGFEHVK